MVTLPTPTATEGIFLTMMARHAPFVMASMASSWTRNALPSVLGIGLE